MGTMVVAAPVIDDAWLAAARASMPREGESAATRLPGVLLARYRGRSSEAAREHFASIWRELREPVMQRAAIEPRIWRT
jgi:urease accessory protein